MQRGRGKKGHSEGLKGSAIRALTCRNSKIKSCQQSLVFHIFFLTVLSSCALFGQKEASKNIDIDISNPKTVFASSLKKICFSGEGKGKLRFINEKRSFSYESMLDRQKEMWSLAFQIPFYGDQLISMDFKNVLNDKGLNVTGNFYQRLAKENSSSEAGRFQMSLLKAYLRELGIFFQYFLYGKKVGSCFLDKGNGNKDEVSGLCKIGSSNGRISIFRWRVFENKFLVTTKINKRFRFGTEYFNDTGRYFNRMRFFLTDDFHSKTINDSANQLLNMNFFLTECF